MKRVDETNRWVRRWVMLLSMVSLLMTWIPGIKELAWSLGLGLVLGWLNFHLLLSGLRRSLRLSPSTARGAFQVGSLVRWLLVGGLLLWALLKGPHLMVWLLVLGIFGPEVLFVAEFYGRTKEESI